MSLVVIRYGGEISRKQNLEKKINNNNNNNNNNNSN